MTEADPEAPRRSITGAPPRRRLAAPPADALPEGFERTERARRIAELAATPAGITMISGRAGTGKTTLIRYLAKIDGNRQVLLAPTGIAALNAGGQTIHSFFRFPPRVLDPNDLPRPRSNRLWREISRIVIDEISMVRADVLDAMDRRLRQARGRDEPFGGVEVFLVGDFLQLPPVVPEAERRILEKLGYPDGYAFSARAWDPEAARHLRLETVYRQTDPEFIALLGRLRSGAQRAAAVAELNARCLRDHRPGATPMILTTTNADADIYNAAGLAALPASAHAYDGKAAGEFDISREKLPVAQQLQLKVGARVMCLKNGPELRWVNGSLGTVVGTHETHVEVLFDHLDRPEDIQPAAWEKVRYEWDETAEKKTDVVAGSYTQLPLTLAWASTIHKAQGVTLEDARIDIGHGAFASGQAYVAVSRARSLDGLSLRRALRPADFFIEPAILSFEQKVAKLAEIL